MTRYEIRAMLESTRESWKTCKAGHCLRTHGSVQFDGDGYACVRCGQCNKIRSKAWREKNAGRLVRQYGNGGQLRVKP